MKLLLLIRANYDKILHFSVAMNIVLVGSKIGASNALLLLIVFVVGLAWEALNWALFDVKPSYKDMIANMTGAIVGALI